MRRWLWTLVIVALALAVATPVMYSRIAPPPPQHLALPAPAPSPRQTTAGRPSKRSWVGIRSTGATGDGATDDTSAIQAALTAASEAGRAVFCPSGTYLVSSTLMLGTDLVGPPSSGAAACTIKYTGAGAAVSVRANPVKIRNVVLDLAGDTHTNTGGILLPNSCQYCVFGSITVTGPANGTAAYLDYGIKLTSGGDEDRFTNISTFFATSAIIAGSGTHQLYQSTFGNVFAHNCGQTTGRACLQINGAVDTVINSGLGGGGAPGAPTLNTVLISGSDAEAIDIIATELFADAPNGTAVVIRRPAGDASVATLIDVRLPVASTLVSDIVTPPRLTRIATQETGAGPVGFIGVAAPAATFMPASGSGITLNACTCTAVAGTVAFSTGGTAPGGSAPFATIGFNRAYPSPPVVILSWNSQSDTRAGIYVDSTSATGATLRSFGLGANTRYVVSYHVVEQ